MFLGEYKAGATIFFAGSFHNDSGTLEDPTSPEAQRRAPDGTWTSLSAPTKQNSKTGYYGATIDTTGFATGPHTIRLAGTVTPSRVVAKEFAFEIVAYDPADAVRLGLTAIPNAAAEASGGLPTLSAAQASNGTIQANVHRWLTATPNALQSGRVDSYLGAVADGVIAAASFASGALDAVWSTGTRTLTSFGTLIADVWSYATRVLTAGTNIVLAKGTGVTGFTDLDAGGVRTAVGLASANLDSQLDALPTAAENASAVAAQVTTDHGIGSYVRNTEPDNSGIGTAATAAASAAVDAATLVGRLTGGRASNLDNLDAPISEVPTNVLDAAVTGCDECPKSVNAILGTLRDRIADATEIAETLLDLPDGIEAGLTLRGALRLAAAALAGKVSGVADNAPVFRNVGDTKDRISATTDDDGNRLSIITDVS